MSVSPFQPQPMKPMKPTKPTKATKPNVPPKKPDNLKFARAHFGYQALEPDELSFQKGDLLYVVDKTNSEWWTCRCKGQEGLVPSNFLGSSHLDHDPVALYPLHDACKRGNVQLLEECLANRVPVNVPDAVGNTPLHWASVGGHVDCVQLLVARCPHLQVSPVNRQGETPLHLAAVRGHVEVIQLFRRFNENADVSLKNVDGQTAYDLSRDPPTRAELSRWMAAQSLSQSASPSADYAAEDYAASSSSDDGADPADPADPADDN